MCGVIQVVDTLNYGGLESVAVAYANLLAELGVRSYICSTRSSGPFAQRLSGNVIHVNLQREGVIDLRALRLFLSFIREHKIRIIHAHGTSLFFSALARSCSPGSKLLWHDHFGRYLTEKRSVPLYRIAVSRADGVIAVNEPLAEWARESLRVPAPRVWYLPNFVVQSNGAESNTELPGLPGKRIVCVANLRPEKDHVTLIDAMRVISESDAAAVLFLVGDTPNPAQLVKVKNRIRQYRLEQRVHFLGTSANVWPILGACDIGVLSSASEGMPLALLEYGTVGLACVATRVGQVPEVLAGGQAGLLVAPGCPSELALGVLDLLRSRELRQRLGRALNKIVREKYSPEALMEELLKIYRLVLGTSDSRK